MVAGSIRDSESRFEFGSGFESGDRISESEKLQQNARFQSPTDPFGPALRGGPAKVPQRGIRPPKEAQGHEKLTPTKPKGSERFRMIPKDLAYWIIFRC